MARADELRLMTRVARLYYDVGLKQPEIATRLRLSQPKVSRLLKGAQDQGIVRISVRAPSGTNPELEEAIETRFGLTEVEIVDISRDDDDAAGEEVGRLAQPAAGAERRGARGTGPAAVDGRQPLYLPRLP